MPRGGKFRPTGPLAPPRPTAATLVAASATAPQEGGSTHSSNGAAAVLPTVMAGADGVQLYVSPNSATGYECVVRGRGGSFVVSCKRFPNTKRDASGRPRCQLYATAQEAAVAYARLVASHTALEQQPETNTDLDEEMSNARDAEVSFAAHASARDLVITYK